MLELWIVEVVNQLGQQEAIQVCESQSEANTFRFYLLRKWPKAWVYGPWNMNDQAKMVIR